MPQRVAKAACVLKYSVNTELMKLYQSYSMRWSCFNRGNYTGEKRWSRGKRWSVLTIAGGCSGGQQTPVFIGDEEAEERWNLSSCSGNRNKLPLSELVYFNRISLSYVLHKIETLTFSPSLVRWRQRMVFTLTQKTPICNVSIPKETWNKLWWWSTLFISSDRYTILLMTYGKMNTVRKCKDRLHLCIRWSHCIDKENLVDVILPA